MNEAVLARLHLLKNLRNFFIAGIYNVLYNYNKISKQEHFMRKILGLAALVIIGIFSSCAYTPPTVDYGYPDKGTSNAASIVVKDYVTLGIVIVKSSETIDGNGNHTGSKITYEMLMLEAQKLGADDVINIRTDINQVIDFSDSGKPVRTTYNYTATALAIKYTTALVR